MEDEYNIDLKDYIKLPENAKFCFYELFKIKEKGSNCVYAANTFFLESDDSNNSLFNIENTLSKLSHPSIISFRGFSNTDFNQEQHPVLITEYISNNTLNEVIQKENNIKCWNDTKKLINIYGIASAMLYLHKQEIIYQNLNPESVFETENFYPKILFYNFLNIRSQKVEKRFDSNYIKFYIAPEILVKNDITLSCDVYSFGMIVYSIMADEKPFESENQQIFDDSFVLKILNGHRPKINKQIPEAYRHLIQSCWDQNPSKRPTFESIINELKNDSNFITEKVDKEEYERYITSIESEINQSDEFNLFESNITTVNLNNFERIELIGTGSFSEVYKIKSKQTNSIYASKIIRINQNEKVKQEINFQNEVKILSKFENHSIMKFIGYSQIDFDLNPNPTIITEYITNGSLEDLLEIERNGFSIQFWTDTLKLINIFGIASSISILHSKNIIHCDLKPKNILLDDFLFPKLSDFGLSRNASHQIDSKIQAGTIGTASFISPEILKENKYSKSSDVYAFGMIVYEIVNKKYPFDGYRDIVIEYKVSVEEKRPKIDDDVPIAYKNLIESCWNQDPTKRPSIDNVVDDLKNKKEFITEKIDVDLYRSYIEYIESNSMKNERFEKHSMHEIYKKYEELIKSQMDFF